MALDATLLSAIRLIRGATADVKIDGKPGAVGWDVDSSSVKLSRPRIARQGVDEVRRTIDGPGDPLPGAMREFVRGNRTMALTITCETNSQTAEETAEEIADDIVAGMGRTDVLALLATEHLGAPRCSDVRTIPYRDAHGDWRSAAVVEAVFPWSRVHVPAVDVTADRIGRVIGEGDVDGHAVPFDVSEP